jgi:hypothetical protein
LTRKAQFDKSLFDKVRLPNIEAHMYRIIKRIVHTVTTVTWLVRLEDRVSPDGQSIEREIRFPASYSLTEEEVSETSNLPNELSEKSQPTLDKGENS